MKHYSARGLALVGIFSAALQVGCEQPPHNVYVSRLDSAHAHFTPVQESGATPPAVSGRTAAGNTSAAPRRHEVRKQLTAEIVDAIPDVVLSSAHAAMCRVHAGDQLPDISLPQWGGSEAALSTLYGKTATVVLFWHPDRWMSQSALADVQREVVATELSEGVAVVGIAVGTPPDKIKSLIESTQARFPQFVDADGKAFAKVGTEMLPRVYVLNSAGNIVWFDIEYSESTRRELKQTLAVLVGKP